MRDGDIEVELERCEDAARLMKANKFVYCKRDSSGRRDVALPMTVEVHRSKNFSRGVISCLDLDGVSDGEIEEGLAEFGVLAARRIHARRGGQLVPTHSVILTFDRTDIPTEVKVGYVSVKVRPYVPAPMRCFRCLRFGHTRDNCRNRPTCGKCASTDHTSEDCATEILKCVNCDATQTPHSAFDRRCPSYLREKEILSLKVTERLSFREARDRYNATHPRRSYASAVSSSRSSRPPDQAQNNISQLITLLQSFGLKLVTSSVESDGAAPTTPQQAAPARACAATQTSPSGAGEVGDPDQEGWTLVRGNRGTRAPRPVPSSSGITMSSPTATRAGGTAATEALRRAEEDRKAREAKRARLLEKAKGAKEARGSEEISPARESAGPSSETMMAPPAPPPPRGPPTSSGSSGVEGPGVTPPSSPKFPHPPPTPGRPAKRNVAWSGSPTDTETPRSRHKAQPSQRGARSSSVDGGLSRSQLAHPRVQFGSSNSISGRDERV